MSALREPLTARQLREAHCSHATAADRLDGAELARQGAATPQWQVVDGKLERTFEFADFQRTMAFVNQVAGVANAEDHHPQMVLEYSRCTVRFDTHSAGGITRNDFICAARIDALPAG
ncbi:MAG TPA: 4a-hydroxytetrahydrobiopterin dehydratase [Burkholderiaceae bacterium]|nr:4a-hydroxytetrahydrobiopterin dehydratase [Burkholderiaceae bacterium]